MVQHLDHKLNLENCGFEFVIHLGFRTKNL